MSKTNTFKKLMAVCLAILLSIPYAMANNADTLSVTNQQCQAEPVEAQPTLANALNPDGTLKKGINGNFNAQGYKISYGKDGQPIFTPATLSGGGNVWDNSASKFEEGSVTAIAFYGSIAYIGTENKVLKWDGTNWEVLATVNGAVKAIVYYGTTEVYVGGAFTTLNGNPANRIAKFTTTTSTWSTLGAGVDNTVNALAFQGTDLYVGGDFVTAGGTTVNHIAKWDGTTWTALGTGMSIATGTATVKAIVVLNTNVYAGGIFDQANGTAANRLAKWDGTVWSSLNSVINNGSINTMAVSGNRILIGGDFTAGTGKNWAHVNTTNNGWTYKNVNGPIHVIGFRNTITYVGGEFTNFDGVATNNFAYETAGNINFAFSAALSIPNTVRSMGFTGTGVMYAGGDFPGLQIKKGEGVTWTAYQKTTPNMAINNTVHAVAVSGNDIYVGGEFTAIGDIVANRIAKWNTVSQTWSTLGTGMNNTVYGIAVSGTDVYAVGDFTSAGDDPITRIAKWNGTSWVTVGTFGIPYGIFQPNKVVRAIAISGTDVYIGGDFENTFITLAKWNGTVWSDIGQVYGTVTRSAHALTVHGTDLYIGGDFTHGGPHVNSPRIIKYNLTTDTWSALGTGTNNIVRAIAVSSTNDVYVGGDFTQAGGSAAVRVAKWNGTAWSALGNGAHATVRSLAVIGADLYVGGDFTTVGNSLPANGFAKWNGTTWSNINANIDNPVNTLNYTAGKLHLGGAFTIAGGKSASKFVIYDADLAVLPVELVAYTATKQANGVALNWQTATETNNSHFVIEKSADGINFTTLASVPAKSSNGASYQYVDRQPFAQNYYRLTQVDYNGTVTELGVKVINFGLPTSHIRLFPNPVINNATLIFEPNTYTSLNVSNVAGQVLSKQAITGGQSQTVVDFSTYTKGVYVVQLTGKSGSQTIKVVKE